MAITSVGFRLTVTLVDSSGVNTSNKQYELVAADMATAITDSATIMTALNGVTDAAIKGYSIAEVYAETGTFTLPTDAEIENMALLVGRLDGNPFKKVTLSIPAPSIDIFVSSTGANRNVVDLQDAAVVAYRSLFQAPGNVAYVSDGETLDVLESGKRAHRSSSRG